MRIFFVLAAQGVRKFMSLQASNAQKTLTADIQELFRVFVDFVLFTCISISDTVLNESTKSVAWKTAAFSMLKLVDGAKGNSFLKIDSIQLNWNSEHPRNEAGNLVNNGIDQSAHALHTPLTWRKGEIPEKLSIFSSPQSFYMCTGTGQAWVTTYLRQLT